MLYVFWMLDLKWLNWFTAWHQFKLEMWRSLASEVGDFLASGSSLRPTYMCTFSPGTTALRFSCGSQHYQFWSLSFGIIVVPRFLNRDSSGHGSTPMLLRGTTFWSAPHPELRQLRTSGTLSWAYKNWDLWWTKERALACPCRCWNKWVSS